MYETSAGMNWTRSEGWLGDGALEDWFGVEADSLGRVIALDLSSNGLAGRVPTALARLTRMATLKIDDNAGLAGPLPLSLRELSLEEFDYASTGLCTPSDPSFGEWLGSISAHEGTGRECAPLSDREILSVLAENWGSDPWVGAGSGVRGDRYGRVISLSLSRKNLRGPIPPELAGLTSLNTLVLDSNSLNGPIPPELGKLSNLEVLVLGSNNLSGPIPPELGKLSSLEVLILGSNDLTGPIPSELGDLSNLNTLWLGSNNLTGPIPPELGNLSSLGDLVLWRNGMTGPIPPELGELSTLSWLGLSSNDLTGTIPPQLGDLPNLRALLLDRNDLTGSIPAALGNLSNLETLGLRANGLTGPIPSELGRLTSLRLLDLGGNDLAGSIPPELGSLGQLVALHAAGNQLSGSVPPELGGLIGLRSLQLGSNARMSGALPASLTALDQLDELLLSGTGLCAPADTGFQVWLSQVRLTRVRDCRPDAGSAAYLTQAVQSLAYPVPLVAGREALLRVFVTAPGGRARLSRRPARSSLWTARRPTQSTSRVRVPRFPGPSTKPSVRLRSRSMSRFQARRSSRGWRWSSRSTRPTRWMPHRASGRGFPRRVGWRCVSRRCPRWTSHSSRSCGRTAPIRRLWPLPEPWPRTHRGTRCWGISVRCSPWPIFE